MAEGKRVSVGWGRADLRIEITCSEAEVVLELHGELDMWTQHRFEAALSRIDAKHRRVILDLSGLGFVDAGNLMLIHRARRVARSRGADLVLRSPTRHVARILELTGLRSSDAEDDVGRNIVLPLPSCLYERTDHDSDRATRGVPEHAVS